MYNAAAIQTFIDKVTAKAEKAAQDVFDKYQPELEARIRNQLQKGDTVCTSMGLAYFTKDTYQGYAEKFLQVLTNTLYPCLSANFSINEVSHNEAKTIKYDISKPKIVPLHKSQKEKLMRTGEVKVRMHHNMPVANGSIIYGEGNGVLFDRIDYRWVYGDTEKYKTDMMNVGRRAKDYPDNKKSTLNGIFWWDCDKPQNPKDIQEGDIIKGGWKVSRIRIVSIDKYPIYEVTLNT